MVRTKSFCARRLRALSDHLTLTQVSAVERKELEGLRDGNKRSAEEIGRAHAKLDTLQQRLDRAEEKAASESAHAEEAKKKLAELLAASSSAAARSAEQKKAEAAAAKAALATRNSLEKRLAEAEAAALAAKTAAAHAGTLASKELTALREQMLGLEKLVAVERERADQAEVAAREAVAMERERSAQAQRAAKEAAASLDAQRRAADASGRARNDDLAKYAAKIEELEGAVRASQVSLPDAL